MKIIFDNIFIDKISSLLKLISKVSNLTIKVLSLFLLKFNNNLCI